MIDALMDYLVGFMPRVPAFILVMIGPALLLDVAVMIVWHRWLDGGVAGPLIGFLAGALWCTYVLVTLGREL